MLIQESFFFKSQLSFHSQTSWNGVGIILQMFVCLFAKICYHDHFAKRQVSEHILSYIFILNPSLAAGWSSRGPSLCLPLSPAGLPSTKEHDGTCHLPSVPPTSRLVPWDHLLPATSSHLQGGEGAPPQRPGVWEAEAAAVLLGHQGPPMWCPRFPLPTPVLRGGLGAAGACLPWREGLLQPRLSETSLLNLMNSRKVKEEGN